MLLVTGHKGFIGGHLTKLLTKRGIPWVGFDLKDGQDIRNKQTLDAFFEQNQITEVIHLAALAGVRRGEEYPEEYISTNVLGTRNIIKLSEKYNVRHLVFYSSSSVYGQTTPPVSEGFVKKPISLYGMTKLMGEQMVENCEVRQTSIVIPFTVYGENGRRDEVIYKWIEQIKNNLPITIYGDGSSERGYVNVHDLVDATVKLITDHDGEWKCEHFNLGGSEVIKLIDLVNVFTEALGEHNVQRKQMTDQRGDVRSNFANTEKAGKMLGFYPEKKLYEKR
jgi:UDP-glucuronate 4-epimerase